MIIKKAECSHYRYVITGLMTFVLIFAILFPQKCWESNSNINSLIVIAPVLFVAIATVLECIMLYKKVGNKISKSEMAFCLEYNVLTLILAIIFCVVFLIINFGSTMNESIHEEESNLVRVEATNGEIGYVYEAELSEAEGDYVSNPDEAIAYMKSKDKKTHKSINVYKKDGVTKIGVFIVD